MYYCKKNNCLVASIIPLLPLPFRTRQHSENAASIATFLTNCPDVNKVFYPGLENHHNHKIAEKQ
jgi:cystathionine beta-lyase/cystathionine gamma-synthase